jgi:hypothetical protein
MVATRKDHQLGGPMQEAQWTTSIHNAAQFDRSIRS